MGHFINWVVLVRGVTVATEAPGLGADNVVWVMEDSGGSPLPIQSDLMWAFTKMGLFRTLMIFNWCQLHLFSK